MELKDISEPLVKACVNANDWTPVQHTPNLLFSLSQKTYFFQKWFSVKSPLCRDKSLYSQSLHSRRNQRLCLLRKKTFLYQLCRTPYGKKDNHNGLNAQPEVAKTTSVMELKNPSYWVSPIVLMARSADTCKIHKWLPHNGSFQNTLPSWLFYYQNALHLLLFKRCEGEQLKYLTRWSWSV